MRFIAALLLFVSMGTNAQIMVMGDSISVMDKAYPEHIREAGYNVRVLAQSGRQAIDYEIPRDLAVGQFDTVVYFLGTNDAGLSANKRTFSRIFLLHILDLKLRGFRVMVLVPPRYPPFLEKIDPIRGIILGQCGFWKFECYDLEDIWDVSMTFDTVHPKEELSIRISDYVIQRYENGR